MSIIIINLLKIIIYLIDALVDQDLKYIYLIILVKLIDIPM